MYEEFVVHCIVLVLWMMGWWDMWGWLIHSRLCVGGQGWVLSHSSFFVLFSFSDNGKDQKPITDFEKILTLSLARWLDLFLSLGVTAPLITPVMDISWPCILEKECFDMLRTIGDGDFVRVFSSFRRYDSVYLGWFVLDWVCRIFMMQASRL